MSIGISLSYRKSVSCLLAHIFGFATLLLLSSHSFAEVVDAKKNPAGSHLKQPVVGSESVMNVVLSLVLVVAAIFLLAWMMRRLGGATLRSNAFLKVISSVSMGARERVVLVQVGEQQLVLGVAPGRVQTLHVLDKPIATVDAEGAASGSFSERLKTILNKEK